ncbi:DUF4258 domain-containing protein [Chitinophaga solisilvae]|uniref:DUF4258 domain-containing protein n=1 Tax=Chitinophaga solisilvae TaxID=1233460 RepID=A0A433WDJ3_9BACT|nr:DUF4258 domain-containing protein [Chitinophaga solisilvae]NSL88175.1 DUF4258 domain-containing protein [Chitinophaga solisilvae]
MNMRSLQKYLPVALLALLLIAGWKQNWWKQSGRGTPVAKPVVVPQPGTAVAVPEAGLNRSASLEYTRHALCRMDCRHVTKEEVAEILAKGEINAGKSNLNDRPCPTYALEGYSHEGQHLRIVFAPCDAAHAKVITCIDLEKDWSCACE